MAHKKRLFTGLQPSGVLHIGNYFGALKPVLDYAKEYESFLMVADMHALTSTRNADDLRQNTHNIVKDYLAVGIDPHEVVLFCQSNVHAHAELAWVLECLVSVSFLEQAHAYKDKTGKGLEANAGLFNYPILMAADMLLYDTDIVPVGKDQQQHVEYTREAARKFHATYGEMFKEPEAFIDERVAVVPGIDGEKMSKSYKNTIPLFAERDELAKDVMAIVTDSSGDVPIHVYNIHKLVRDETSLARLYEENRGKYKILKEALIEDLDAYFAPIRERRKAITDQEVAQALQHGEARATEIASVKLENVYRAVGLR